MTGLKIALYSVGIVGGSAGSLTGIILAQVPAISPETPLNLTFALVAGGLATTATLAWKVSRAWSKMESTMIRIEERLNHLEKKVGE